MKSLLSTIIAITMLACTQIASAAVTIVSQPTSVEVEAGSTVTFTVVAKSNRSIRYYWYKNGTMISVKTSTLTVTASESTAAAYTCLVSDGKSKANCTPFTLALKTKPGTVEVKWDRPTRREDGTLLGAHEIGRYELLELTPTGPKTIASIAPDSQIYILQNVAPGTHRYFMLTYDIPGTPSKQSAEFSVTVK